MKKECSKLIIRCQRQVRNLDLPRNFFLKIINASLVIKQGWATKQGALVRNWKRRWFELSNNMLSYYLGPQGKKKGEINILECEVSLHDGGYDGYPHIFQVAHQKRTFFISADSGLEKVNWVETLKAAKYLAQQ